MSGLMIMVDVRSKQLVTTDCAAMFLSIKHLLHVIYCQAVVVAQVIGFVAFCGIQPLLSFPFDTTRFASATQAIQFVRHAGKVARGFSLLTRLTVFRLDWWFRPRFDICRVSFTVGAFADKAPSCDAQSIARVTFKRIQRLHFMAVGTQFHGANIPCL
jgi:hypothetical protein